MLYGGAVGGGKTDALLACALRWVDHPKHRALILRRTRPQLQEVIDRSIQLYTAAVPGTQWREAEGRWKFPSGAIIQMGYAEHEKDIYNYKSFEYNLICFDEVTSFTEAQYSFMFLRNRTKSADLPLQIRSGTNPGDIGHDWVLRRFIGSESTMDLRDPYRIYDEIVDIGDLGNVILTRQFIPSRIWDNPSLPNREEYVAGITSSMTPEDRSAYLDGRWDMLAGAMFKKPMVILPAPNMLDTNYFVVRAVDYGWDDPTCVLWLVVYPKLGAIDVIAELYVRETTLDGIVNYIKKKEEALKLPPVLYSVGSPEMGNLQATSGQTISSMLTMKGVHVEPVSRGTEYRKASLAKVQELLESNRIRTWPLDGVHGCPNLIRTLPKLQRNSGPGKSPDDIRPRQEDHAFDALRYGIMTVVEVPKTQVAPVAPLLDPSKFDVKFDKIIEDAGKQRNRTWIPDLGEW